MARLALMAITAARLELLSVVSHEGRIVYASIGSRSYRSASISQKLGSGPMSRPLVTSDPFNLKIARSYADDLDGDSHITAYSGFLDGWPLPVSPDCVFDASLVPGTCPRRSSDLKGPINKFLEGRPLDIISPFQYLPG